METVLLIGSLFAFLILTINCLRLAFSLSGAWGIACLLPVSWLPFYGVHWRWLRPQGIAHLASLVAVLLFSALYVRAYPFQFDAHRLASVRDWVAPAFGEAPLEVDVPRFASDYEIQRSRGDARFSYGRIDGAELQFQQVVYDDGLLRFKQLWQDEPVEVAVDVSALVTPGADVQLDLTPDAPQFPLVHVLYHQKHSAVPVVRSYDRGYWLELSVTSLSKGATQGAAEGKSDGRYDGHILLRLPDARKGFVAGSFSAGEKDVLWEFGDVARTYDSNDTIEHIAEQYLANRLGSSLDSVNGFSGTFFQTNLEDSTGQTRANITMVDGSQHQLELLLYKNQDGWVVERSPVRELVSALEVIREAPPAAIAPRPVLAQPQIYTADEIEPLVGREVTIVTYDGKLREGKLDKVDRYNVSLVSYLAGGEVSLLVKRREVKEVVVKE